MKVGNVNIFSFVLEDDVDDMELIKELLQAHGIKNYKLFQQENDLYKHLTGDISVCILDHRLRGGVTGLDVCKKIRELSHDSYIIIMTAQQDRKVVIDYLNIGADKYIDKNDADRFDKLRNCLNDALAYASKRLEEMSVLQRISNNRISVNENY